MANTVTLYGSINTLNAALVNVLNRGDLDYSGNDNVIVGISDGIFSTSGSVAINIKSVAKQAAELRARVQALRSAGVLNTIQAKNLLQPLQRLSSNGDPSTVEEFSVVEEFLAGVASFSIAP